MHFSNSIVAATFAIGAVSAAPASNLATLLEATPSITLAQTASGWPPANEPDWIIKSLRRDCKTNCVWTFAIDTQRKGEKPTACTLTVHPDGKTPATQAAGKVQKCGKFQVSSGWDRSGFTTIAVADTARHRIAFPSYGDKLVPNGKIVKPDLHARVYIPQ